MKDIIEKITTQKMKHLEDLIKSRCTTDIRFILLIITIAYIIAYFNIPATPGNYPSTHPLGWWGWFDQGQYLLSAEALTHGDLTPEKHYYPPLYPALGAIFLNWSSGHMYFVLNLLALLWFAYVFVRFSDRYIPRWGSTLLLFGTTVFSYKLFEQYVIPWTSTLSISLLASGILGLVWLDEIRDGIRSRISWIQVLLVALSLGLIVPTRPADSVVGAIIGVGLLTGYWNAREATPQSVPLISHFLLSVIIGSIIGPLFFFSFNTIIFGSPFGGYMHAINGNGFFLGDLAEKFVSIWLDGFSLYGEKNAGLIEHYPWLLISFSGLIWALTRGDRSLKLIALAIVLHFIIYLPYNDLLPNGVWRYYNIHYFKWTFPFLALLAVLLIRNLLVSWHQKTGWIPPLILLVGIPILLLSIRFTIDTIPASPDIKNNPAEISFNLPPDKKIDFIDIKGLSGGFTDIYFGSHRLLLDGHELKVVKDYRLLPINSTIRVLFIRPVAGQRIELFPDKRLTQQASRISSQIGIYHFSLGKLKPFTENSQPELITDYHIGEFIDFSRQGNSNLYTTQGWSEPEDWGRWSINNKAGVQLHLTDRTNKALELELLMSAFVSTKHPCQKVSILANDKELASQLLCLNNGGETPSIYKFKLPKNLISPDNKINISLITPNSISPKALSVSADDRVLGVGIRSFKLNASKDQN